MGLASLVSKRSQRVNGYKGEHPPFPAVSSAPQGLSGPWGPPLTSIGREPNCSHAERESIIGMILYVVSQPFKKLSDLLVVASSDDMLQILKP